MTQNSHFSERIEKIGFFSPLAGVGVDCGYGYAAVELIKAWQRLGVPVWGFDRDAPVAFNMGQPQFYERIEGKLNIGYTPWESTGVPESWVKYMNLMDEIWTPCYANVYWYRAAGVTVPMKVLPHGLNPEHWPLKKRQWDRKSPFKFLHIGGDANRKGAHHVYRAFKEVYGDSDKVHLTLKGRRLSFDIYGDNVTHLSEIVDAEALTKLHHDHHAMIYPTNGEGFGLIPFQAAATGMPTAVTNWSGPADYIEYCYPISVKDLVVPDYEPHVGLWADPDYEDICKYMKYFVEDAEWVFEDAYERGKKMLPYWSWDNIAKTALESMIDSLDTLHK